MDIKKLAVQMLMNKMGGEAGSDTAESALDEVIGRGSDFNIGDVIEQFTGAGGEFADKAQSWLGDGDNHSLSGIQVQRVIGGEKIEAFASKLGVTTEEASSGLSEILPHLIDKSSRGGELLDAVGGAGGLAGLASKFFSK